MEPDPNAQVLEYLPVGSEVRISVYPLPGGWYRIRSKTGDYGWVQEDFLSVKKPKEEAGNEPGARAEIRPERDRQYYVRALLGLDFFRPEDLNDVYGFKDLSTGYTFGGEFGYFVNRNISLGVRVESLSKSVLARETTSGHIYNLSLRSYPVMAGADFYFLTLPALRFSLGIYAGLAAGTSFTSEDESANPATQVVLQSNPFTTLARLNVTRPLGRVFSVFAELGYRYLRTEALDTSAAKAAQQGAIFGPSGAYYPRVIDLSGAELSIGAAVHF
jgi:hypothetical protein